MGVFRQEREVFGVLQLERERERDTKCTLAAVINTGCIPAGKGDTSSCTQARVVSKTS
jgi:hypothetical protein